MKENDFVRTIEAVYDVEGTLETWLANVLGSARPWFDTGAGIWGCSWGTTAGAPTFEAFVNIGGPPVCLLELGKAMPPDIGRSYADVLRVDFVGPNSRVDPKAVRDYFIVPLRPFGIVDIYMVHGRDTIDRGVCIGRHLRRYHVPRRGEDRLLSRVGRHLVAGSRLRARLEGRAPTDADAAAILTPGGRVEHATAAAKGAGTRAALRDAVLAVDRARGVERRRDPEGAVRRWRVLADARFSLIDRFESDGRRYVVACENELATDHRARLTPRERQIVALYRQGADSKIIAYELGLADATVRVLLSRAARRLGVVRPRALRETGDV